MNLSPKDREILRDLAKDVAEAAADPIMEERRNMWKRHNALDRVRPMVLIFPEGSWRELLPDSALACEADDARGMERNLRMRLYYRSNLPDDTVIEREWVVRKHITSTGWGLESKKIPSTETRGSWKFDPVINEPADLKKLRHPEVIYDEEKSRRRLEQARELFGDILDIKEKGVYVVSFHLMAQYTILRGLGEVMMDMVENPSMLHDAMSFLTEGHIGLLKQYQEMNLLSLNNDSAYHSSGGVSYSDELPAPGFDPDRVRPCDMWASAESQEMAQVSPKMHREFVLDYEKRLLAPFGLNGYGCCEDLTRKLDDVLTIPNIRRISISPWADVEKCAEGLGDRAIFSWKPNPAMLVGDFSANRVRECIKHTLEATRGCVIEIILKDTHTCENHPERFAEWTRIARELAEEY